MGRRKVSQGPGHRGLWAQLGSHPLPPGRSPGAPQPVDPHLHSQGLEPETSKSPSRLENPKLWAGQRQTSMGVSEVSSKAWPRHANGRTDGQTDRTCLYLICPVPSLIAPGGVRMAPSSSGSTCFSSRPVARATSTSRRPQVLVMCPSLNQSQVGLRDQLNPESTWSWGCVHPTHQGPGNMGSHPRMDIQEAAPQ